MSNASSKVAAEMRDYSKTIARGETKRDADAIEAEKRSYRLQVEAQAEVANEDFWRRAGRWSDQEYRDICAQLPPRPGSR